MLEMLEAASTTPTRCVEFISEVATIANELVSQTEVEWEKVFFSKKKQNEIVIENSFQGSILTFCVE